VYYLKFFIIFLFFIPLSLFSEIIGDASWYGEEFQGKPTASGEPFDMYAYTTAHRTLPFGTILKVTNLANNKSVDVRVNDRGPVKENRIVDLSYQAAKKIGMIEDGIAEVSIEIKKSPSSNKKETKKSSSAPTPCIPCDKSNPYLTDDEEELMKEYALSTSPSKTLYSDYEPSTYDSKSEVKLQIAAFSSELNAKKYINEQKDSGFKMDIIEVSLKDRRLYKVVILCSSKSEATRIIRSKKYIGAYIL